MLFGVETNRTYRFPVSEALSPATGVFAPGFSINAVAVEQNVFFPAEVAVVRGDKAKGAMQVFGVVPVHECAHPVASRLEGCEGSGRIFGAIFESSKK